MTTDVTLLPLFIEHTSSPCEGFKRSPRRLQVETGVCGATKMCQLEFEYLECHEETGPPPEWSRPLSIYSLTETGVHGHLVRHIILW